MNEQMPNQQIPQNASSIAPNLLQRPVLHGAQIPTENERPTLNGGYIANADSGKHDFDFEGMNHE